MAMRIATTVPPFALPKLMAAMINNKQATQIVIKDEKIFAPSRLRKVLAMFSNAQPVSKLKRVELHLFVTQVMDYKWFQGGGGGAGKNTQ
jgi:hypothetical protein